MTGVQTCALPISLNATGGPKAEWDEADPRVQEVLARFPGAKVVEVRKLAAEPPESDSIGEDPTESSDGDDD